MSLGDGSILGERGRFTETDDDRDVTGVTLLEDEKQNNMSDSGSNSEFSDSLVSGENLGLYDGARERDSE